MSDLKDRSYEDIMSELTTLVANMEVGEVPLETLFANFEKGMTLLNECKRRLNKFNKRIEVLNRESEKEEWNEFDIIENNSRSSEDNSINQEIAPF